MKVYFLVAVTLDRARILADNPPENVVEAVANEMRSHLDDKGVRGALGVTAAEVRQVATLAPEE